MIVRNAQANPIQAVFSGGHQWSRPEMGRQSLINSQLHYEPTPGYGRPYEPISSGYKNSNPPSLVSTMNSNKDNSHIDGGYGYGYAMKSTDNYGQTSKGYGNESGVYSYNLNSNRRNSGLQYDGHSSHENKENLHMYRERESSLYEVELGRGQNPYGENRLSTSRARRSQQYPTSNSTINTFPIDGISSNKTNSNFENLMGLSRVHTQESDNETGQRFEMKRKSVHDYAPQNNQYNAPQSQTYESNPPRAYRPSVNLYNSYQVPNSEHNNAMARNKVMESENPQVTLNSHKEDTSLASKIKFPERFRQPVINNQPISSHESTIQYREEVTYQQTSTQNSVQSKNTRINFKTDPEPVEKVTKQEQTSKPQNSHPSGDKVSKLTIQTNIKNEQTTSQSNVEVPEAPTKEEELFECFEGCGRFFTRAALKHHEKACKKVFQSKRKAFNIKAKRLELKNQEIPKTLGNTTNHKTTDKQKKVQVPKWKLESAQLRVNLKQARGGEVNNQDPEIKVLETAKNQQGIICPNCHRNFNEKAAERHLPFCAEKAKEKGYGHGLPTKGKSKK